MKKSDAGINWDTEHTCRNCGQHFTGKYCNACGEKIYTGKDRSVIALFYEGFHFITHFEGTFFNTLKVLLTKPGKFSLDFCNGIRKKYFKPIGFLLMLVIIYLLFPLYQGLNVPIYYHTHDNIYGQYALRTSLNIIKEKSLTDEKFVELFHHAGEKVSKFLLFLLIPAMALVSWVLSFKKRKHYFDNFIFSTEAVSFFILFGALLLPFFDFAIRKIFSVQLFSETIIGILIITVFAVFLFLASRRFFIFSWWYSIVYALVFSAALILFINYVYNFLLFFIAVHLV